MSPEAGGRAVPSRERPVAAVPPAVRWVLAAAIALQVGWHAWRPDPRAEAQPLRPVPAAPVLHIAALGDRAAFARLLMLGLLIHDRQPGASVPFMHLDYERVAGWLDAIIDLDPRADAPLLAAARLYGSVSDPDRQRTMFALVHRRFLEDPARRWPWLAHAAVMAKHRLGDPALALRYARALTEHATGPHVPAWVRDMSVLIAADVGELETARILIGGLLLGGRVRDPREIRFLGAVLEGIEARAAPGGSAGRRPGGPTEVRRDGLVSQARSRRVNRSRRSAAVNRRRLRTGACSGAGAPTAYKPRADGRQTAAPGSDSPRRSRR